MGESRSLFFAIIISIFLVSTLSSRANSGEPKRRSCAYKVARAVEIGILAFAVGAPLVAHSVGMLSDAPHVGLGIYFDWDGVESRLSPELQQALADPARDNQRFIADLSAHMQKGLSFEDEALPLVHPRMASEYIGHLNGPPVSCRHKSLIMAAILRKAGIRCQVKWGKVDLNADDRAAGETMVPAGHVWIYLPDTDQVADPTQGWVMDSEDYHAKYVLKENLGDFAWTAKTVGLLIR